MNIQYRVFTDMSCLFDIPLSFQQLIKLGLLGCAILGSQALVGIRRGSNGTRFFMILSECFPRGVDSCWCIGSTNLAPLADGLQGRNCTAHRVNCGRICKEKRHEIYRVHGILDDI